MEKRKVKYIVYSITSVKENKSYFGTHKNTYNRYCIHLGELRRKKHHAKKLQEAFDNYGEDDLRYTEIKEFDSREEALKHEAYLITGNQDCYNSAYTLDWFENHPRKGYKLTQEQRDAHTKRMLGRKHSDATRNKMRNTSLRLGRTLPEKAFEKRRRKIQDSLGNVFNSMKDASDYHHISVATVCDILKGRHSQTRKKISFKYVDDKNENT